MILTPKNIFGTLFSLVITAFLLTGLLIITNLAQKQQNIKKTTAAGETINLDLVPSVTSIDQNGEFTVIVQATPTQGHKVTAVAGVVNFTNLTLVSITPEGFFSYPAGTEMLNFGTSCTQNSDCRATGISCVSGYCKYANNTAGTARFDLGAACSVAEPWVCYPATAGGNVAKLKFRATGTGTATISFGSGTAVAALDSTDQPANNNTNVGISGAAKNITINGTANGGTLNFKIKFAGMTVYPTKTVRVKLMTPGTTTQIARFDDVPVTANTAGVYSGTINSITPGTYDIFVKDRGHMQKNFGSSIFTAGATTTKDWSATSLVGGDIAGSSTANGPDNMVDSSDLGLLINEHAIGVNKTSIADLTGDSKVDSDDLILVINNFKMGVEGDGGRE